jgi:hypothetical protein
MRNGKYYKGITLTALTLLVFSACSNATQSLPEPSEVVDNSEIIIETEASPSVSRFGNNMNCVSLKTTGAKEDCLFQQNELIGVLLESEILSTFDIARCDELIGNVSDECKSKLTESGVKGPVFSEEIEMFNEITWGQIQEVEENDTDGFITTVFDISKCDDLKTEGYKEYCREQLAQRIERQKFDDIIMAGDSKKCDTLPPEFVEECKIFFHLDNPIGEDLVEE